jgi:hypothetical protein
LREIEAPGEKCDARALRTDRRDGAYFLRFAISSSVVPLVTNSYNNACFPLVIPSERIRIAAARFLEKNFLPHIEKRGTEKHPVAGAEKLYESLTKGG